MGGREGGKGVGGERGGTWDHSRGFVSLLLASWAAISWEVVVVTSDTFILNTSIIIRNFIIIIKTLVKTFMLVYIHC